MKPHHSDRENILQRIRQNLKHQDIATTDNEAEAPVAAVSHHAGELVDMLAASCRSQQTDLLPAVTEPELIDSLRVRIESALAAGDKIGYCCAEEEATVLRAVGRTRYSLPASIHRFLTDDTRIHKIYPGTCSSAQERKLLLSTFQVLITACEVIAAFPGVIVSLSDAAEGRLSSLLPIHHWVIATEEQIIPDLAVVYERLSRDRENQRRACITFIAGPSRTADIEKKLILGVHGPLSVSIFLLKTPVQP